jgi:hypothetical protein
MRTVRLVSQEHLFALTEDVSGDFFLEVFCGGFAMYELEMKLSGEEVEAFRIVGGDFLASLAKEIRRKSPDLLGRAIEK